MAEINALGGLLPVINKSLSVINTIDRAERLFSGSSGSSKKARAERDLALQNLKERQAVEENIAAQKLERERAILGAMSGEDERRRLNALKRETARQRAEYGGSGVGADEGSAEAVLLGLFSESEDEKRAGDSITALKRQILDDNFSALKQRNLLELSQMSARGRAVNG